MIPQAELAHCDAPVGHCITCSDEGIPMRVVSAGPEFSQCQDEAGERHEIATDLVGALRAGDTVLVHAGVAIGQLAP